MIDEKLIKDTITELLSANVDKDTIYSTLKDIGVELGDIEKYYTEVTTSQNKKTEPIIEEKKPVLEKPKSTADLDIEKQETDLKETEKEVSEINNNFEIPKPTTKITDSITAPDNDQFLKQISELQDQVGDIKAQINALTKIMKDILEENRNILNKLK